MYRILVIEDTREIRENISEVLRLEGFQVFQAEDGESGIQMALDHDVDLILCDIMMPGMDGYEVLKSIKKVKGHIYPPFIFISALEQRRNIREGMELGADDYLIKPFTIEELLKAVMIRLEKQSSLATFVKSQIEAIEEELQSGIARLKGQINLQEETIKQVAAEKEAFSIQLKDKQDQLMKDALRSIEINNLMQEISSKLTDALRKDHLTDEQRRTITDLKNRLRNRSILLNNQTIFLFKFEQTYPSFRYSLLRRHPKLNKQDLVLLASIYLSLDTNQLGSILNISAESVRKKRYRLKLKMGLGREEDFKDFLFQIYNGNPGNNLPIN